MACPLGVAVTALNPSDLSKNCQDACTPITKWLHIWHLKANCSKTDILVFKGTCDIPVLSNESNTAQERIKNAWDPNRRRTIFCQTFKQLQKLPSIKMESN